MGSPTKQVEECLPPQPPTIMPKVQPKHADLAKHKVMPRPGLGRDGRPISLLSNYFNVRFSSPDGSFYHYSVSITSDDKKAVEGKGIGRRVMDRVYQTYASELDGKQFAYDGEKSLFTVGPLPQNNLEFMVVLEEVSARRALMTFIMSCNAGSGGGDGSLGLDRSPGVGDQKRSKRAQHTKTFKVEISFAARIPMKSVALALKGTSAETAQDALRALDIILRQIAAKRGCLLVRQSFFHDDVRNFTDLGGGVTGCRGFHSSFRTTQAGLALNMDVSTTMIMTPGPVIGFVCANQNVRDVREINWPKVSCLLAAFRISRFRAKLFYMNYYSLSSCVQAQKMLRNMRIKATHNNMEFKIRGLSEMPCNQQYFPLKIKNGDGTNGDVQTKDITLCSLVSLQRYTKSLSTMQRSSLVEKSRQKPQERIAVVTNAMRSNRYDEDAMLSACGISIDKQLTQVDGRVLSAPTVGNSEECVPRNGRWNFNNKQLLEPTRIERWAVVNFSARCDMSRLCRDLISCGRSKGVMIERPFTLIDEDPQLRKATPIVRVERMVEQIKAMLPGPPQILLCVLPERKNSEIYGPWKKKNLHELGIVTQCLAPTKINDQYLTNLLLKINSKLGGKNSLLAIEMSPCIPLIDRTPTMILGMDVSHGSPGQSDVPSIAAVVGSRYWPLISRYRASVRTQSPKAEMIDSLFKPLADGKDDGIMRDGVSESQFNQVLNIELDQIIKAFEHLGESWLPKFTVIIAQKNHHTKLFQAGAPENVPPGTVVDTKIVHPGNYDFYMCAHAGMIGTSRPTHYHVLLDEIGFSPDDLQKLVHSLSYVYQRSTTATSIVAPISYAHLAAQQMMQFIKFEEHSETSSVSASGPPPVPELPRLHEKVCDSISSELFRDDGNGKGDEASNIDCRKPIQRDDGNGKGVEVSGVPSKLSEASQLSVPCFLQQLCRDHGN
ncbi:Protein argonaute 16 [Asimina triloba]